MKIHNTRWMGTGYNGNLRVFDFVKLADTIVMFHGFQKKTQKTPTHEIAVSQQRLEEVVHGHV